MDKLKELLELLDENNVVRFSGTVDGLDIRELEFACSDEQPPAEEGEFEIDWSALEVPSDTEPSEPN